MGFQGYLDWTPAQMSAPPMLAGYKFATTPAPNWRQPSAWRALRMEDGSNVAQLRGIGANAPLSIEPWRGSFDVRMTSEGLYYALQEAVASGKPVDYFPGFWTVDVWSIPAGGATRSQWVTSRRVPYDLAGVTTATHPSECLIDGVVQTPVLASPTTGQCVLPTANQPSDAYTAVLTTPAGLSGQQLVLRYPALYAVQVEIRNQVEEANSLIVTVSLDEVILGGSSWESL